MYFVKSDDVCTCMLMRDLVELYFA